MNHPHPECTLERVRELERQLEEARATLLALRAADSHLTLHAYSDTDCYSAADVEAIREILAASAPPPVAEPVTEQERAVLRAMAEIDTEVLEHIERGWSAAHPIWHPPALAELALRRAVAREGKP